MIFEFWIASDRREIREWRCCDHVWQLVMSFVFPKRYSWAPTCPTCSTNGRMEMMLTVTAIDSFQGEYRFLSNFYPVRIMFLGASYPTMENAYQVAKVANPQERIPFETISPGQAKRLGRTITKRPDWDNAKLIMMELLLRQKFCHFHYPELREKLLQTGNLRLIEGNTWNDTFWGVCKGIGENHLGKLLMQRRDELRKS